jgi:hypothetical protein
VHFFLCWQITDGGARDIWTKALGHGVHFDRVDVCFFKVGEWNTEGIVFGSSSSGHVRAPFPMMRGKRAATCSGKELFWGMFWLTGNY